MQRLSSKFTERIETLRSCRYFDGINEDILAQLAQDVYLYRYNPGEIVFWEGGTCAGLHIVRSGSVKLFKVSPNGRQLVVTIFNQGESFNEVPVFDSRENPISVAAITQSDIWVVACQPIRQAINEHPEMARAVILNLSTNNWRLALPNLRLTISERRLMLVVVDVLILSSVLLATLFLRNEFHLS